MRRLLIAALLGGAVFAQQSQPPSPTPPKQAGSKQKLGEPEHGGSQTDNNPASSVVVNNQFNSYPTNGNDKNANSNQDIQSSYEGVEATAARFMAIFTGLLVVTSFVTVVIARKTLRSVELQTQAAIDSSIAAINSQRAWVTIEAGTNELILTPTVPGSDGYHAHMFTYRIWNAGKSTATEVRASCRYVLLNSLADLSETPQYAPVKNLPQEVLVPTDNGTDNRAFWGITFLEPKPMLFDFEIADIEQSRKILYAFGIAYYKNGLGKDAITAFGFAYHFPKEGDWRPKGFYYAGPKDYNRCT